MIYKVRRRNGAPPSTSCKDLKYIHWDSDTKRLTRLNQQNEMIDTYTAWSRGEPDFKQWLADYANAWELIQPASWMTLDDDL